MKLDNDLHDDDFLEDAKQTQRRMAILGFFFFIFLFLLVATTVYFFLAAAGIVPTHDVVPVIPYI